jgi:LysM repeat protein
MQKTKMMRYALMVFLLLPLITFAQSQEIKKYKIIKGDTLWDISERDLNDPFMWPAIWKLNKWIANPHWIYPGQIIKIPLYLIQKEKSEEDGAAESATASSEETFSYQGQPSPEPPKEEVKKETPTKNPLVHMNILMTGGYIADTVPGVGHIDDLPPGQIITGSEDIVYLTMDHPAKAGDKFYVINSSKSIKHPITGRKIGYVITIKGIVEIVKIKNGETTAKITTSFSEIYKGDRLDSYYDIEPPMTEGKFRSPDINGMIIATGNTMALQSMLDIIYIDKGCKDGIEAGDMFRTIAVGAHAVPNGRIQVISCKDHTATAIIKSSITPISAGNIFTGLNKN